MRIVKSVRAMQRLARHWPREGGQVAFVPTMGCLHEGHAALLRAARAKAGQGGKVVASIYVNPTQFGPGEDYAKYPRPFEADRKLCRACGVDVLFAPSDGEMYPREGGHEFSTHVVEEQLSRSMEGASRPSHFRGVTTVVAKLFHIVRPDVAFFGAKDFQQAAVIQRMVVDLNFPIEIVVLATVREPDGLAMSSRNRYLSAAERDQATVLWHAIQFARKRARRSGRGLPAAKLRNELRQLISTAACARVDYIEFFDPATLQPVRSVKAGTHIAMAVFLGRTRLIDNARL